MNYQFSDRIQGLQPSVIREFLKFAADPTVISLAAGNPAPEAFPVDTIAQITAEILRENPITALQYSISEGYPQLRDAVKKMVKERYRIGTDEDEVLIVSGATQGMDLLCHVLCNEGDTVICEDPSFIGSLNAFRSFNANLVGIPMESDGMDIAKLEEALNREKNVKLIYIITNFQNPTGFTTSWEKRKAIYELAKQHGVVIVEDNPYGDLRFAGEDIPAIKTLDTEGVVAYCGTFSKLLAPGLRVGYLVVNKGLMPKLTVAKQCSDVHTTVLSQMICERFISTVDLDAHIAGLRKIYRHKAQLMMDTVDRCFPKEIQYHKPEGGLFLWCTMPFDVDTVTFCSETVQKYKVAAISGTAFLVSPQSKCNSLRLNYTTPTDDRIVAGIELLGKALREAWF